MFYRRLQPTEEAFAIANQHFPLCVVIVLQLKGTINETHLRNALDELQNRHVFLKAGIIKEGQKRYFISMNQDTPIPVLTSGRIDEGTYKPIAEKALNTKMDEKGPVMWATHISANGKSNSELILAFHHSFVDSINLQLILDELLKFLGGVPIQNDQDNQQAEYFLPKYPRQFRGLPGYYKLFTFGWKQFIDELHFRINGASHQIPESSKNKIVSTSFSLHESREIITSASRQGLSLNSVLNAAMLLAVISSKYGKEGMKKYRTIAFANLRPFLEPVPEKSYFGSFIAMLRFTLATGPGEDLTSLASRIQSMIIKSGRRGDIYHNATLSKVLMKMALLLRSMRLSNTALSFMGKLDLQPKYGPIQLLGVEAYITNNRFGPEFSGFGKILFGRISLDFTYLVDETSHAEAEKILFDMKKSLLALTKSS